MSRRATQNWREMKVGWGKERRTAEVRRLTKTKSIRGNLKVRRSKVIRIGKKMKNWGVKERTGKDLKTWKGKAKTRRTQVKTERRRACETNRKTKARRTKGINHKLFIETFF